MNPVYYDIIYYSLLFGSFFFILWFVPRAIGMWKGYLVAKAQLETERVLLEIRIPREINKTPLAMELVLNGMTEPSDGDWYTNITSGKRKPFYSLEIASHGGDVHFYIYIPRDFIARTEAHFYAQYPAIELVEVKDYAKHYPFSWDTHKSFGFEYELAGPDPIPIMTYKSFGLDKAKKEFNEITDPITQTIEALANIGPQEEMWVQIVISSHKGNSTTIVKGKERWKAFVGIFFAKNLAKRVENFWMFWLGKKGSDWKAEGIELIKKIREAYTQKKDDKNEITVNEMTKLDKIKMDAIAENITKPAYDVGIRTLYNAPKEHYNGDSRHHMMGSLFKQYSAGDAYNSLKPGVIPTTAYPWQDKKGKNIRKLRDDMYRAYVRRAFIYKDLEHYKYGRVLFKKFVMSTEELATIYHLPGQVAATPSFERIESVTGQAPSNLPL